MVSLKENNTINDNTSILEKCTTRIRRMLSSKRLFVFLSLLFLLFEPAGAIARFPKPDFTQGYQYPEIVHEVPWESFWSWMDLVLMCLLMGMVVWAIHFRKSRRIIIGVSLVSVAYFGFFRTGCVCSIGSIQNVALALADGKNYTIPLVVLLLFLLPLLFALFFGRVYCGGVCPMGAIQELVNVHNFRISRAVSWALGLIPWIYLAFAILYAATRSQFIICKFDPFIGIFRLGGDIGMIVFGALLLILSVFVGRPFCRFLCPYGVLLGLMSSLARRQVEVTSDKCINCTLCHHSCPVDAIREPTSSNDKHTEDRNLGIKRILLYMLILPLLTIFGALLLQSQSERLSLAHRDVWLYEQLQSQNSVSGSLNLSPEVEAFHEMGRDPKELQTSVLSVRKSYRIWAAIAGGLIGFVLGCKLIRLSTKRTRKTYETEPSSCVACGRCFNYCPQNLKKPISKDETKPL